MDDVLHADIVYDDTVRVEPVEVINTSPFDLDYEYLKELLYIT